MKAHIDYQTIDYDGKHAFVLVPWEEFRRVQPMLEGDKARATGIPQAVVEAHLLRDVSMIRAWREHIGITQSELATRLGVSQAAVAKLEKFEAKPRGATLKRIAEALKISVAQLDL